MRTCVVIRVRMCVLLFISCACAFVQVRVLLFTRGCFCSCAYAFVHVRACI